MEDIEQHLIFMYSYVNIQDFCNHFKILNAYVNIQDQGTVGS